MYTLFNSINANIGYLPKTKTKAFFFVFTHVKELTNCRQEEKGANA